MKKAKIKSRIIAGILILIAVLAVIRINIEPSDYRKEIAGQIEKAVSVYQEAEKEKGNQNGQYSWYTLGMFKAEIIRAKETAESAETGYEAARDCYKELKKTIREFKKAANRTSVMSDELKKQERCQYENETANGIRVSLTLNGQTAEEGVAVNFDVQDGSPWDARIETLLQETGCRYQIFSFLQNGAYPDRVSVRAGWTGSSGDIQIYAYDSSKGEFGTLLRGETDNGETVFSVESGGVYVLLDRAFGEEPLIRKSGVQEEKQEETEEASETEQNGGSAAEEIHPSAEETEQAPQAENPPEAGNEVTDGGSEPQAARQTDAVQESESENQDETGDFWEDEELWLGNGPQNSDADAGRTSHVTLEVRCDTIVDTSKLTNQAVASYVPEDGVIFPKTEIAVTEGESVFEVLQRTMRNYGIQMEFREDPLYSGAYVEGIGHIYEFDAGSGSGWMYKVDGWFPNYGCSRYYVTDGEEIVWCYTCDIGKDVGDQYWDTH